ncbi:MAG TPA: hypothetical protein VGH33_17710 [Isosphaeraceae bacterium]|jgi:hypothetical protein
MEPFELWDEPWEGLPEEDEAWTWELIDEVENGKSRFPPDYKRWYLTYRTPSGERVRISVDRDPRDGRWFNPHPASIQ